MLGFELDLRGFAPRTFLFPWVTVDHLSLLSRPQVPWILDGDGAYTDIFTT